MKRSWGFLERTGCDDLAEQGGSNFNLRVLSIRNNSSEMQKSQIFFSMKCCSTKRNRSNTYFQPPCVKSRTFSNAFSFPDAFLHTETHVWLHFSAPLKNASARWCRRRIPSRMWRYHPPILAKGNNCWNKWLKLSHDVVVILVVFAGVCVCVVFVRTPKRSRAKEQDNIVLLLAVIWWCCCSQGVVPVRHHETCFWSVWNKLEPWGNVTLFAKSQNLLGDTGISKKSLKRSQFPHDPHWEITKEWHRPFGCVRGWVFGGW